MKTISENYNGKVTRTSSLGFSPKRIVEFKKDIDFIFGLIKNN